MSEGIGGMSWIASGKLSHKEKLAQTDLKKIIITRTVSQNGRPSPARVKGSCSTQENTLIAASFGKFSICNLYVCVCVCGKDKWADKQAQQIMEKYAKNCLKHENFAE